MTGVQTCALPISLQTAGSAGNHFRPPQFFAEYPDPIWAARSYRIFSAYFYTLMQDNFFQFSKRTANCELRKSKHQQGNQSTTSRLHRPDNPRLPATYGPFPHPTIRRSTGSTRSCVWKPHHHESSNARNTSHWPTPPP